MHTIAVPADEQDDHESHGDVEGSCTGEDVSGSTPVLVYSVPVVDVPLDLAPMSAVVEPGHAYTLVVRVAGRGAVLLGGTPGADSSVSGVSRRPWSDGDHESISYEIDRSLDGWATYTQSAAHDVIASVTLVVETTDGSKISRSAALLGQTAVANPWLGAIPGELPSLQLTGN